MIKVVYLDHYSISQHDQAVLTEYLVDATYIRGIVLEYGGKKQTMIPENVLKEVALAARDVVHTHTTGQDSMQDKFVERLANLIGEGNHV